MDSHHVPSLKLYFTVFAILMVGTAVTVRYPIMLVVAAVVTVAAVVAYVRLQRRRTVALAAFGVGTGGSRRAAVRRHLPYVLLLAALPLLLGGLARPEATIEVPRVSGTVMLVFDVSNSMAPLFMSNARNFSSLVAPMNSTPPAVIDAPP